MTKLKNINWSKLSKTKKFKMIRNAAAVGTAALLLTSLALCSRNNKRDRVLTTESGKLYLVDVLDEEKKLALYDSYGRQLQYNFNENTVAVVGSRNGKTMSGKDYEVMLINDFGNITYGYMDGKYLSDTYLDSVNVDNSDFMVYYVSSENGTQLVQNGNLQEGKNSTLLRSNIKLLGSVDTADSEEANSWNEVLVVDHNKFLYGYVDNSDITQVKIKGDDFTSQDSNSTYSDGIYGDDIYVVITYTPLNVRSDANTGSGAIDQLPYGTDIIVESDVTPKIDDKRKWVYISYKSTSTGELAHGWVAAEVFDTNEDYIVKKSSVMKNGSLAIDVDSSRILAPSAAVLNATTGEFLYSKNGTDSRQPASITKILTGYIVEKYGNLDDTLTYSHRAVIADGHSNEGYGVTNTNESKYGLRSLVQEGTTITVRDALHLSLLLSDNCSTIALEEYIESITNRKFADIMNEEAKNMGCTGTHFTNSYGYQDPNHVTTSQDMARILGCIVNESEEVTEILGKPSYTLESYKKANGSKLEIYHQIGLVVDTRPSYNKYAIAAKSGFHNGALHTLVSAYEKDGIKYVVVSMGNSSSSEFITDAQYLASSFGFGATSDSLKDLSEEEKNKVLVLN